MSWVRVWIHLVFSTKNREPFLRDEIRSKLFEHIQKNAQSKEIWLDTIGGHNEHVHCLISLGREQTISQIAQLIKGESSFWINNNKLTKIKFQWQDDYWAVGLSESHLLKTRKYILEQNEHHRIKTFSEEIELFMNKYGWKYIQE